VEALHVGPAVVMVIDEISDDHRRPRLQLLLRFLDGGATLFQLLRVHPVDAQRCAEPGHPLCELWGHRQTIFHQLDHVFVQGSVHELIHGARVTQGAWMGH
jgi:hypothetical protein